MRLAAKPVPALALVLLVTVRRRDLYGRGIALGLVLCAFGDTLLELPGRFVPGLCAFLAAHLAYAATFVADTRRARLGRAAPFALWLFAAGWWLWPGLGDLKVPVAVYMAAIGVMMWRAAARVGAKGPATAAEWSAALGAVLFGLSDTLLAVDRFRAPLPAARYAVILLYWAGLGGIAASAVLPDRLNRAARDR